MLYLQSKRGQFSYMISTEAPGPLTVNSLGGSGTRLNAAWMDDADGYTVELSLPGDVERISVGAVAPAFTMTGVSYERYAGTLKGRQQGDWLELVSRNDGVSRWLSKTVPGNTRAWLVQADGWVVADSGPADTTNSELTWAKRMLYQAVADSDMPLRETPPLWPVRFDPGSLSSTLLGGLDTCGTGMQRVPPCTTWWLCRCLMSEVAAGAGSKVIGAVVLETRSEGLF